VFFVRADCLFCFRVAFRSCFFGPFAFRIFQFRVSFLLAYFCFWVFFFLFSIFLACDNFYSFAFFSYSWVFLILKSQSLFIFSSLPSYRKVESFFYPAYVTRTHMTHRHMIHDNSHLVNDGGYEINYNKTYWVTPSVSRMWPTLMSERVRTSCM